MRATPPPPRENYVELFTKPELLRVFNVSLYYLLAAILQLALALYGVLDILLASLGLGQLQQQWLGNRGIINYSLAGVSIWRYVVLLGFILLITAIQSRLLDNRRS